MVNPRKAGLRVFGIAAAASFFCTVNVLPSAGTENQTHQSQSPNSPQSQETSSASSKDVFDFSFFKSKVEPIFLKERPGHARCSACHLDSNRLFHLERLSDGAEEWTEEQSRRNFQVVTRLVTPGDPRSSLLLIHPLAPEAGGDAFHSGGRQFATQNDPDWLTLADWVRGAATVSNAKVNSGSLIYVTNSAGGTVDVVDPATNSVLQVIRGIELPHGVNFSPDGSRVYISDESQSALDVINRERGEIVKKIPLSGRPNNLTITKDGAWVLVGIRTLPGAVDVIDTSSLALAKTIPINRSIHNIYVTPDGKFAVAGSIESKSATVIDLASEQVAWEVKFDNGVRPMAFDTNPDGSTKRIFVQLSNLNGFAVVDFAKHVEIARVKFPDHPGGYGAAEVRLNTPSHGIGVAPNGKSLWIASTLANAVFQYSLPDLKLVGYCSLPNVYPPNHAPTGSVPEWITFTPDSTVVYISNSGAASVSAIDARTRKLTAVIPVGEVPKRMNTLTIP
ncbi:MAG TPA: cytochrome D1 domain-containing protein [Candidatus Acidoferrum sp.]|nr:cytochrome D1 domain-containing protein [Candidatus Acidoferrum sp.]